MVETFIFFYSVDFVRIFDKYSNNIRLPYNYSYATEKLRLFLKKVGLFLENNIFKQVSEWRSSSVKGCSQPYVLITRLTVQVNLLMLPHVC